MDPIANFLTAIKNAILVRKASTDVPYSKMLLAMSNILLEHGFISGVAKDMEKKKIKILFRYDDQTPTIHQVRRISKPGRRYYTGWREIPRPLRPRGIIILSTPKGILSHSKAKKSGVGGEILCEILP